MPISNAITGKIGMIGIKDGPSLNGLPLYIFPTFIKANTPIQKVEIQVTKICWSVTNLPNS
ncbi:hypothetical protein MAH1_13900 [Sessilibacter sp. MAH1]